MPVNKNAYLRYLVIHSEILRNKYKSNYPNKQDLLWALEEEGLKVSEATLEKDLAFLKYQRFAPIEYNATQRCYLYTEDWNFDIPISPAAIKMMHMLLHKLQIFAESREFIMLRESIEKLSDYFDLSKRYPEPYDKYILFEYTKGFAGKHHLPAIYDAIYGSLEIDFTHCKFDKQETTARTLQPYILKEHRNRWYVIGRENGEPRIFGLERITELSVTERRFEKDNPFYDEIFRVMYDSVGVMAFGYHSEEVLLRFNKSQSGYIKTLKMHRSQEIIEENDSGILVKLYVKITPEFIMDCILRYGENVKVIQPQTLSEKVSEIFRKAIENYT